MKLITINGNGGDDHDVAAHRADCQDVAKAIKGHDWFEDEAESKRALWLNYNSDFLENGGGAWPIHFYPCTKGLPDGGTFNTDTDEEPPKPGRVSHEDIEKAKTPEGGWTRSQLEAWGVSWPPPAGWKDRLAQ